MRKSVVLIVCVLIAAVAVFVGAGRLAGPAVRIVAPGKFVGASTPFEAVIDATPAQLASVQVAFEQHGVRTPIATTIGPHAAPSTSATTNAGIHVTARIGRDAVPAIATGPARIVVTASRRVLFGLRRVQTQETRDVQVRLDRPQIAVVSTHHYVNLGGSEAIVYRVTPQDVASGVVVGDIEYPGFPAAGAKVDGARLDDPALRVAFFALRYDQALDTPIRVFARDEAGNQAQVDVVARTFPKPFRRSHIELTDEFLNRVVPAILAGTTEVKPTGSLVEKFVVINGDLRRKNATTIAGLARQTSPEMLWGGTPFHNFANTTAESAFADDRSYFYHGQQVDEQTHLGFDLASYAGTTIVAANRGKVLWAKELGIYGNCVIIDHGMGVQSLYGHLSRIDVQPGQMVDKGQPIGKSGETGLAGGDHLHFTMLVNGQMVNPLEWWDPHWIQDRIVRKLQGADSAN